MNEDDRSGYVEEFNELQKGNPYLDRSVIFKGNQESVDDLEEFLSLHGGDFDIIIDDGSHFSKHIIASFKFLFKYLSNNGLYIIEDLQTSYFPRYGGSRLNLSKKNTSMNFIKKMTDAVNYEHHDRPFYKKTPYDGMIKSVNFYQNIVFIRKGESRKFLYGETNKSFVEYLKKIISYIYK